MFLEQLWLTNTLNSPNLRQVIWKEFLYLHLQNANFLQAAPEICFWSSFVLIGVCVWDAWLAYPVMNAPFWQRNGLPNSTKQLARHEPFCRDQMNYINSW